MPDNIILSIYKNARDTKGLPQPLPDIIKLFSQNVTRDTTLAYRTMADGPAKDEYKKKNFGAVTWSGTFKKRAASALAQHSGLICIDVDKLTKDQHDQLKQQLTTNPYVFFLFTSPSGAGLKIIFKISNDATQHLSYFLALENYFAATYQVAIDKSGKDVSRMCFIGFDNHYYYNDGAHPFALDDWRTVDTQPGTITEHVYQAEKKQLTPTEAVEFTSTETLDGILKFTEKKATYVEGSRNAFINLFAWNCNLKGIPQQDCENYALTFTSDLPEKEVKDTIKSVYSTQINNHGKYQKGRKKSDTATHNYLPQNNGRAPENGKDGTGTNAQPAGENAELAQKVQQGRGPAQETPAGNNSPGSAEAPITFWSERKVTRGKGDNKFETLEYDVKKVRFIQWLFQQGFFILKTEVKGGYQLCYSQANIIETVETWEIKQFVFEWCERNVIEEIHEMMRGKTRLFSMDEMTGLKAKPITFKRDTETESYFYFKNAWVTVTAEAITTHSYTNFQEYIWAKQQKTHDFTVEAPTFFSNGALNVNSFNSEFSQFVYYVAYNPNNPDEKNFTEADIQARFDSFTTAIGYMLDGYKHPANRKAVFAIDHKIGTDKNEKHGGTGKSIIPKACDFLKVVSTINGDEFDPKYQFRFELITADSQIVNFNDMPDRFDPFELFTVIADDYSVLRRNNGHLHFKYENSPKVWYSTNSVPKGDGSSYARRMFTLEFSDFFTPENTPFDHFGHGLFSSAWSEAEWNRFYNFMLWCVQSYKFAGLLPYPHSNLNERRLKNEVSVELIDFMDDLPRDRRTDKKPWLESARKILQEANGGGKPLTSNSFHRMIKRYCASNGLYFNPHIPPGKYDKSGGIEYYTIATNADFKVNQGPELYN